MSCQHPEHLAVYKGTLPGGAHLFACPCGGMLWEMLPVSFEVLEYTGKDRADVLHGRTVTDSTVQTRVTLLAENDEA